MDGWSSLILAVLLGFAIFGYLRARADIEERFDVPISSRLLGTVMVFGALAFLFFVARSVFGAIIGGVVLATSLYATYRLRHAPRPRRRT